MNLYITGITCWIVRILFIAGYLFLPDVRLLIGFMICTLILQEMDMNTLHKTIQKCMIAVPVPNGEFPQGSNPIQNVVNTNVKQEKVGFNA